MVATVKPSSPRALRRDIPRGLANVVVRCLAKAPAERPQSYAELANLLRPYASQDEVPAPLGPRVIAWIADAAVFAIMTWLLSLSAWMAATPGFTAALLRLAASPWLTGMIYFAVLEGGWGASLGKRLMGLRVTSPTGERWWLRVGLRTAVFHLPIVIPALFMGAARAPGVVYTASPPPTGWTWHAPPDAVLSLLLTLLLFSTARRRNGWSGIHELLSRTRVVQRHAVRAARSADPTSPADRVPALSSLRRVGPYAVHTPLGETGGGRLSVGVDPILRRRVWVHEVAPGTAGMVAIRRDVVRPGRLYWLAGRRSPAENWDAYEAPGGEPLLSAPSTADWREVHRSLSSLAIELDASVREAMEVRPTLAHVWKRPDGHLILLDFPWPGLAPSDARQHLGPVELLAAVSRHRPAPRMEPPAPLPATTLLNRLASGAPPALADIKATLLQLASIPSRPSRIRRALPIAMAAMPLVVPILAVTLLLPSFARRSEIEILMWMTWITESGADAELETREQRAAAEQYVAAHFGSQLASDEFWNTLGPQMGLVGMRRRAAEIAARHPTVSPDELARASSVVAPQIRQVAAWRANFPAGSEALSRFVASGFASIPVLFAIACGLMSVLAVPGGLVTRALGHAVVRRDGREVGRVRSAVRLLIAWSPAIAWMAWAGNPMFGDLRAMSPAAAYAGGGLALMSVAAGAVWTVAVPSRGPHDRIAGTWVVPR
jgi:hypothetical protein